MKIEVREREIELIPENDWDRDILARLRGRTIVEITDGRSTDPHWPPDPRKTNVILKLSD